MTKLPATTSDGEIVAYDDRLKSIPFLNDEQMQELSITSVFTAPSLEDAMDVPGEGHKFEEFAGEIILIHFAGLRPSETNARAGVFALIDATIEATQERVIISNGSPRVLAVLARAYSEDKMPLRAKVMMGEPSKKGRHAPYYLIDANRF